MAVMRSLVFALCRFGRAKELQRGGIAEDERERADELLDLLVVAVGELGSNSFQPFGSGWFFRPRRPRSSLEHRDLNGGVVAVRDRRDDGGRLSFRKSGSQRRRTIVLREA